MDIVGAAALIAAGIVLAAVLYTRTHPARVRVSVGAGAHPPAGALGFRPGALKDGERRRGPEVGHEERTSQQIDLADRAAELARREAALSRREETAAEREAELELERPSISERARELERSLERVSGLSTARAKELLLKEIEDQARHYAARRVREIEEQTKREAERGPAKTRERGKKRQPC